MNLYLLDDPAKPGEFARFSHVGTWSKGSLCKNCGVTTEKLIEPLQIEWDKGTERIGSFSWCGYTCVVTDEVRKFLEQTKVDCTFGRVEVMPPTEKTKRPRVPFPYTGPRLHWLIPARRLPVNQTRSGVQLISDCAQCGEKRYSFKRDGLVIDAATPAETVLFVIDQFGKSRATFITEPLLAWLKSEGFTNLCPRLAGTLKGTG
jgi:hypothetical protein